MPSTPMSAAPVAKASASVYDAQPFWSVQAGDQQCQHEAQGHAADLERARPARLEQDPAQTGAVLGGRADTHRNHRSRQRAAQRPSARSIAGRVRAAILVSSHSDQ